MCLSDSLSHELVVGERLGLHGAACEIEEEPVGDSAAVEAVDELQQVARQVAMADTAERPEQPGFQVRDDRVDPRQDLACSLRISLHWPTWRTPLRANAG